MHVWGVRMSRCACVGCEDVTLCMLPAGTPSRSFSASTLCSRAATWAARLIWLVPYRPASRLAPVVMVCKCEMPVWWAEVNSLTAKK